MNPDEVTYNGIDYRVDYQYNSANAIVGFSVYDKEGQLQAITAWDEPEVLEGDILGLMEENGFSPDVSDMDIQEEVGYVDMSAVMDRKLDEIVRLLKKIEKNTRK